MRIKRLKLAGFKSFVDPTELRIEPGLTGVVGPNGCGKSNLLEALRWTMGESSPKSMRGGGMEDVIFAGTDARPARDFAEVSILAERDESDRPDNDTVALESEVEVVRRIERGAGSAYRVNGRDVRAKDVALLFADAATGAHSPALVSQGKIGAVVSAKPAERRQMLEEAAGIAGLHVRRKDAEQKLRATETNLSRLDDLLADMDGRIRALKRQANAARRYRKLTDQIELGEARLVFARWRDAAAAAEAAKAEAERAETQVAEAAERQRAAAVHQADAARKLAEQRNAAQESREAASALGHELAALKNERNALERRIDELANQRENLSRDRGREDALASDAAAALERLGAEEQEIAARLEGTDERLAESESKLHEAETVSREAELAMARALAAQASQQADIRVAEAGAESARQRLARAEAEAERIAAELAELGDAGPLERAYAEAETAREAAEARVTELRAAIETADEQREAAADARDTAESETAAARAALAALESEAQALAKGMEDAVEDKALGHVRAAKGYEKALAAALGDDLEAGLGETSARRWSGSETHDADPALPPGIERLADHVTAPVQLMRRLAQIGVVETDDGAIDLAVGQRLVTRDGSLRRWDGYVASDEGAAAADRLMRANRLEAIEAALPDARADVEAAAGRAAEAVAAVTEARTMLEDSREALGVAEDAARAAIREQDGARAAIERLADQQAGLAERRDRANAELEEAKDGLQEAEAAVAGLPDSGDTDASVERLKAASEAARLILAEARAEAATIGQAIDADKARLEAARAEADSWRNRAGEAARRVQEMTRRETEAEAEAKALADAPAEIDAKIRALQGRVTEAEERAESARAEERAGEERVAETERLAAEAVETLSAAREHRAGGQARFENAESRRREFERIASERFQSAPGGLAAKFEFDADHVAGAEDESAALDKLKADRERIGPVNLVAESELEELETERDSSLAEREELGQAINRLRGSIGNLNREGRARLLAAFEEVDKHFRRLFGTLFQGGQAHLALIDSDDPLEAGLEIMAQPPGKKLATLTLLSGGEQALTAVALIFALFLTNPAPICVLDEVDAPLDDANIERFCELLDQMAAETDTRYLIVTHNAVTMARMHRLYGVTMVERGVSRLVSVDLGGAETLLAAE
ncbi:chromosome segregation protein SMC [Parasphingopyxis algicola]|uniref:chromosome segregation protein SMC n=1 Tax=Parasphingopyxis algicola TaxID=2026624 RepID=UPI0015A2FBD5|nr:chromosome segregation protein SMC [Parasphingopyxis algicola]QLC24985.1 chromosome segregation protein SMC [Parasphingopyxis algicola]